MDSSVVRIIICMSHEKSRKVYLQNTMEPVIQSTSFPVKYLETSFSTIPPLEEDLK